VRLYEPSIRVPLIIRGPDLPKGKKRASPANVDLAPTILAFAKAKAGRNVDGRSLLPVMREKLGERGRGILLEAFFNADPDEDPDTPATNYQAVRTDRYLFARYAPASRSCTTSTRTRSSFRAATTIPPPQPSRRRSPACSTAFRAAPAGRVARGRRSS
jgi:arylsulfatase A-like enzyme